MQKNSPGPTKLENIIKTCSNIQKLVEQRTLRLYSNDDNNSPVIRILPDSILCIALRVRKFEIFLSFFSGRSTIFCGREENGKVSERPRLLCDVIKESQKIVSPFYMWIMIQSLRISSSSSRVPPIEPICKNVESP